MIDQTGTGRIYATNIYSASEWQEVAPVLAHLAVDLTDGSFFLSPAWVNTWLQVFGSLLGTKILIFAKNKQIVGACLLTERTIRRGPFAVRRIYLNTAGEDEQDSVCAEFTALLCRQGSERQVTAQLAEYLRHCNWDEIVIDSISSDSCLMFLNKDLSGTSVELSTALSRFIDLNLLRRSGAAYEATLGPRTRRNYRRSVRLYGGLCLEATRDVAGTLRMLDELIDLHQRTWRERGEVGSFASESFTDFHRQLIKVAFPIDNIHLIRVFSSDRTVGVVYLFSWRKTVYAYQCGFRYEDDSRYQPGLATWVEAIRYFLSQGYDKFRFLGKDMFYKQALTSSYDDCIWLTIRKKNVKMNILLMLVWAKRYFSQVLRRLGAVQVRKLPRTPGTEATPDIE